ncbi:HAD family hydrolase [Winogradskyella sp.]|uniref:HAD family hydrolase n=1 Tax=Winogradskyella sp. TaxID=1883156 RepID=UPI0025F44201|nr:HAD family hydrolase [Winogradskyella sp.]
MKRIVAFDFDGTLTKKDSFIEFIKFSRGKVYFYFSLPYIVVVWSLSKIKVLTTHNAKEKIFIYFYKGMSKTKFDKYCDDFIELVNEILRDDAKFTIEKHLNNQSKVLIVSASIENWIQPWATANGIKTVLATQVEIDSRDNLTGRFSSLNCNKEEKVNRLLQKYPNIKDWHLTVYGDTVGDKALMKIADKVFYKTLS